ncbi:MAG: hypothetical protein NTV34_11655 [Proteobacteria bacterium]|nr:hypothetical protein [Pseudomonadota bacterium]
MRLIMSVLVAFFSGAAFSASDCRGHLSLDSGSQWSQVIKNTYDVDADYWFSLNNIILRTERPGQPVATAEYDFCEVTTLGEVSKYECSGFEGVDTSIFPSSIHVTDVKNPDGRAFTFYGENKAGEGKIQMTGKVTCED